MIVKLSMPWLWAASDPHPQPPPPARAAARARGGAPRARQTDCAAGPTHGGSAPVAQVAQGPRQIFAPREAQAAAGRLEPAALDKIDRVMGDCHGADLFDNHRRVGEAR